MTKPRLLLDTLPLTRLLGGDKFLQRLVDIVRGCGYWIGSTEAVLVEALYFAEKSRMDLSMVAAKLLALFDVVEALREEPLRSPFLRRLGYTDTELLIAAKMGNAVLLTSDEQLALEAQGNGVNAYAVDWLLSLGPREAVKLPCPVPPCGRT